MSELCFCLACTVLRRLQKEVELLPGVTALPVDELDRCHCKDEQPSCSFTKSPNLFTRWPTLQATSPIRHLQEAMLEEQVDVTSDEAQLDIVEDENVGGFLQQRKAESGLDTRFRSTSQKELDLWHLRYQPPKDGQDR